MINISVIGACGKMGTKILDILSGEKDVFISGAIDVVEKESGTFSLHTDINEVIQNTDVFIDFSSPLSLESNLEKIVKNKKSLVIGTTGLSDEKIYLIKKASNEIPIVFSPNMSIGVNVFFKVLKEASRLLKDYDIEVTEIHHNKKKDAPSGTAVKIAEIITENADKKKEDWIYGREGLVGERTKEEIGIHALRLGDVVGEHSVYFCGNNEMLEFTHRAHSRDNFASGAVKAAKWLYNKKSGLYDMSDVLGLK